MSARRCRSGTMRLMGEGSFTVVQLSDIHWGAPPAPIDGRDPSVTLGHVIDHVTRSVGTPDLFVATGDLTDSGSADEAASLAGVLGALGAPVHCVAGNHDSGVTLGALVGSHPALGAPATSRHGNWLFCYSAGGRAARVGSQGLRRALRRASHRVGTPRASAPAELAVGIRTLRWKRRIPAALQLSWSSP